MDLYPYDPRKFGSFVEERRCTCGYSELFSIEIRRIECDFMDRTEKRVANVNRVAAGIGSVAGSVALAFFPTAGPRLADAALASQIRNLAEVGEVDLTHTALEILYKCRSCGHKVHVTYEIMKEEKVSNEFGRYTDTYERPLVSNNKASFLDIERVYRSMRRRVAVSGTSVRSAEDIVRIPPPNHLIAANREEQ
uniref:Tat pathway signal protein n=1 Tax=Globodera pallida TaxID=36090 RepID=A0A183BMJ2_GLOPA